jgi:hypothetical protein
MPRPPSIPPTPSAAPQNGLWSVPLLVDDHHCTPARRSAEARDIASTTGAIHITRAPYAPMRGGLDTLIGGGAHRTGGEDHVRRALAGVWGLASLPHPMPLPAQAEPQPALTRAYRKIGGDSLHADGWLPSGRPEGARSSAIP